MLGCGDTKRAASYWFVVPASSSLDSTTLRSPLRPPFAAVSASEGEPTLPFTGVRGGRDRRARVDIFALDDPCSALLWRNRNLGGDLPFGPPSLSLVHLKGEWIEVINIIIIG